MKPSPGQVSSIQNLAHPRKDGSWFFAIETVTDTFGALHHTASPNFRLTLTMRNSCLFLWLALYAIPPWDPFWESQRPCVLAPFCIPTVEISIMHSYVGFSFFPTLVSPLPYSCFLGSDPKQLSALNSWLRLCFQENSDQDRDESALVVADQEMLVGDWEHIFLNALKC